MVLIGVDVHAAVFLEVNKLQPVVLFEVVKGWVTGSTPEIGEMHHVSARRRPHQSAARHLAMTLSIGSGAGAANVWSPEIAVTGRARLRGSRRRVAL